MYDYLFSVAQALKLADDLIFYLMACCAVIAFIAAIWHVLGVRIGD